MKDKVDILLDDMLNIMMMLWAYTALTQAIKYFVKRFDK
jgi:hypothetical protein